MKLQVLEQVCTGCGDCVDVCAVEALTLAGGVVQVDEELCIECEACVDECQVGALSMGDASRAPPAGSPPGPDRRPQPG